MTRKFLFVAAIAALCSCATSNRNPVTLGIFPLVPYTNITALPADTAYRVITREEDFNATFRAESASSRKPGFGGQTVVAVMLPKATVEKSLQWQKAEVSGNTMNVYLASCNPANSADCAAGSCFLATTARSTSVNTVQFFIDNSLRSKVKF